MRRDRWILSGSRWPSVDVERNLPKNASAGKNRVPTTAQLWSGLIFYVIESEIEQTSHCVGEILAADKYTRQPSFQNTYSDLVFINRDVTI